MFKVENERTYYVLDRSKNNCKKIGTFSDLIYWLASVISKTDLLSGDRVLKPYRAFDFSGSDIFTDEYLYLFYSSGYAYIDGVAIKRYVVFDQDNRIIDIRLFEKEIIAAMNSDIDFDAITIGISDPFYTETETIAKGTKMKVKRNFWSKESRYRFRDGSVPYMGKNRSNAYKNKRHSSNWKKDFKCRHQWQKHNKYPSVA